MDALPTDVERALQHAIGQANSAYTAGIPLAEPSIVQMKKAKKRAREDSAQDGDKVTQRKRKKKKTHGEGSEIDLTVDATIESPVMSSSGDVAALEKKKTKKSKKKKRVDAPSSGDPPPASIDPQVDLTSSLNDPSPSTLGDSYYPSPTIAQQPSLPNPNLGMDPFSHLNTNDDILRVFQDLDLTRLAGVLRGLEMPLQSDTDPNASTNPFAALLGPSHLSDELQTGSGAATPAKTAGSSASTSSATSRESQAVAGPSTAAKRPTEPSKPTPKQNANLAPIGPSIANPEHTTILATKWLSAAKLKELVETEGLVYKKGKFSALEEQAIKTSIENYRVNHGLSPEQVTEVVFSKTKEENNSFWSEITASVPARPIVAVYHHVRRVYHPLKLQGKWTEEEDSALLKAIADLGQTWEKISHRVGRTAQDCRDRWRNHLAHRSERQTGHWSKTEEEELTRIVHELTTNQGKNSDNDIFWTTVSQRMGNKRSRQQCRIKWTDALNKTVKNGGQNPRWSKRDAFILVQKVAAMNVRDDSEIDWKLLSDDDWNFWSAHSLQRRWRALKHAIKGHEEMAFQEIVEILKQKNAVLPVVNDGVSKPKPPRKEPKSAAVIEEDEGVESTRSDG